jgi:hypothetical protein
MEECEVSKHSKRRYAGAARYHAPQNTSTTLTPREEAPEPTDPVLAAYYRRLRGTDPTRRAIMGIGKQRLGLTIYASAWADCITAIADSLPRANVVPFRTASPVINGRY